MSVITKQSVLRALHEKHCLDTRRLSHVLGVEPDNEMLSRSVQELLSEGRIHRVSGTGPGSWFVAMSFEH